MRLPHRAVRRHLDDLDKSIAEATEQRRDEHEEYVEEAAPNQAVVEFLGMAKNRLNNFKYPTLHEAPEPVAEEEEFFA